MVTQQRTVVDQTQNGLDVAQDALDAAILADEQTTVLLEDQKRVCKTCQSTVNAAYEALDAALNNLEDANTLLQSRVAAETVAGDLVWGPHHSVDDASAVNLTAINHLLYLESSLSGEINHLLYHTQF